MALRVTPIRFSPFDKFIAGILKMKLEGCLLETVFSSAGAINILRLAEEEGVLGRVGRGVLIKDVTVGGEGDVSQK